MFCDLHTHSTRSDGSYTPTELVNAACSLGLEAVALCDHNTVAGLPEFLSAAAGKGIEAVPGAEFSVDWQGKELHLVGLFLDPRHFEAIAQKMEDVNRRKEESNRALVSALRQAGYSLDYSALQARNPGSRLNRAHVAEELVRLGYVESVAQAFDTLLGEEHGYYRPPLRLTAEEMILYLRSLGATPVLAHPLVSLTEEELRRLLPLAVTWGLKGMEVQYSTYSPAEEALTASLAEQFGLLPSGGSDFHGTVKPDISLGTGRGNLEIPYRWLEALRRESVKK